MSSQMLPRRFPGHSAVAAISRIKETRPRSIKFVCLLAAPEGIETLQNAHPDAVRTAGDLAGQGP